MHYIEMPDYGCVLFSLDLMHRAPGVFLSCQPVKLNLSGQIMDDRLDREQFIHDARLATCQLVSVS